MLEHKYIENVSTLLDLLELARMEGERRLEQDGAAELAELVEAWRSSAFRADKLEAEVELMRPVVAAAKQYVSAPSVKGTKIHLIHAVGKLKRAEAEKKNNAGNKCNQQSH